MIGAVRNLLKINWPTLDRLESVTVSFSNASYANIWKAAESSLEKYKYQRKTRTLQTVLKIMVFYLSNYRN